MPRSTFPAYRKRTLRLQEVAVVTLTCCESGRRRDVYLGQWNTPASREAYARAISHWEAAGRTLPPKPVHTAQGELSMSQLTSSYLRYVRETYTPSHLSMVKAVVAAVLKLYGTTPARSVGPVAIRTVREAMVHGVRSGIFERRAWSRGTINRAVRLIGQMFRWAAARELLPASQADAIACIEPLRRGRTTAPETAPIGPADPKAVDAVRPLVSRQVRAMVDLQLVTGMRPGEACRLRPCDVDRSGPVWIVALADHKNAHRGQARTIWLGPRAQAVLLPFMHREPHNYCFAPRFPPTAPYTEAAYRRAVVRACEVAKVKRWSPNQLRHNYATEIRKRYGLEAAQILLGHSSALVTDAVYAERDGAKAAAIAAECG